MADGTNPEVSTTPKPTSAPNEKNEKSGFKISRRTFGAGLLALSAKLGFGSKIAQAEGLFPAKPFEPNKPTEEKLGSRGEIVNIDSDKDSNKKDNPKAPPVMVGHPPTFMPVMPADPNTKYEVVLEGAKVPEEFSTPIEKAVKVTSNLLGRKEAIGIFYKEGQYGSAIWAPFPQKGRQLFVHYAEKNKQIQNLTLLEVGKRLGAYVNENLSRDPAERFAAVILEHGGVDVDKIVRGGATEEEVAKLKVLMPHFDFANYIGIAGYGDLENLKNVKNNLFENNYALWVCGAEKLADKISQMPYGDKAKIANIFMGGLITIQDCASEGVEFDSSVFGAKNINAIMEATGKKDYWQQVLKH